MAESPPTSAAAERRSATAKRASNAPTRRPTTKRKGRTALPPGEVQRETSPNETPPRNEASDRYDARIRSHRERQASVAAILERTFGEPAKCSPDLWERRAYLMLVGLVYERLATSDVELPTEELVKLAKVLAENRRAQARRTTSATADPTSTTDASSNGELPRRLRTAVRQLYGANLSDEDSSSASASSASTGSAEAQRR